MDDTGLLWDCSGFWLAGSLSNTSMARTKKTSQMGEGKRAPQVQTRVEVHIEPAPPVLADPPVPEVEWSPTQSNLERRVEEAEKLGKVGRLSELSPTHQLAQMAGEAGPSMLGGEEPARRKLWPTMGGKAPQKQFLKAGKVKQHWRYQLGIVALHEICWFQKSMDLLIHKLPFHI